MIFQDPYASLNPRQKVKDIIIEPMLFHKIVSTKEEAEQKCIEILEKVGLRPEQAGRYPHQFSGGQRQRIGIARALAVEPEFIIADEPVSALDVSIQAQILNLLMDLKDEYNFSYMFIAHDLSVVQHISDRLGVMYLGSIVEMGNKSKIFNNPLHPYTKMLFSAVPTVGEEPLVESFDTIGEIPSPVNLPSGCFFHERCPYAMDKCLHERPKLVELEEGHSAACHLL
jgi:oligopeptide/dipeptide ABC transporter ATP-binding protein